MGNTYTKKLFIVCLSILYFYFTDLLNLAILPQIKDVNLWQLPSPIATFTEYLI